MRYSGADAVGRAVELEAAWLLKLGVNRSPVWADRAEWAKRKFLERYNHDLMRIQRGGVPVPQTIWDRPRRVDKRKQLFRLMEGRDALAASGCGAREPRMIKLSRLIAALHNELDSPELPLS